MLVLGSPLSGGVPFSFSGGRPMTYEQAEIVIQLLSLIMGSQLLFAMLWGFKWFQK